MLTKAQRKAESKQVASAAGVVFCAMVANPAIQDDADERGPGGLPGL